MGRNINSSKLTKQLILSKVSQVTIFSTYLNLSDKIVQYCIDTGELICSPIRDDVHPTCGFRYDNKGKLKFRDFAGYFWGDCFDIVALIMGGIYNKQYDISNREDFVKVLRHITFTFKDIFYGQEKDINLINEINTGIVAIKHKKPNIELVVRNWNEYDKEYWGKFGVPLQYLNINFIYPVEQYYINRKINPEPKYFYNTNDPCYGYCLGQDRSGVYNIKLYFPNRKHGTVRFITNSNCLEGLLNLELDKYDAIIITKSTKDRISLRAYLDSISLDFSYGGSPIENIGLVNIPHESYKLKQNEYDWLRSRCPHGYIVSLMDNDNAGYREAIWLRDNYNIIPFVIPKEYDVKDFAELKKEYSGEIIDKLIIDIYNYIEENYKDNGEKDKLAWDTEESSALPY